MPHLIWSPTGAARWNARGMACVDTCFAPLPTIPHPVCMRDMLCAPPAAAISEFTTRLSPTSSPEVPASTRPISPYQTCHSTEHMPRPSALETSVTVGEDHTHDQLQDELHWSTPRNLEFKKVSTQCLMYTKHPAHTSVVLRWWVCCPSSLSCVVRGEVGRGCGGRRNLFSRKLPHSHSRSHARNTHAS